jgi:hypothetical protein
MKRGSKGWRVGELSARGSRVKFNCRSAGNQPTYFWKCFFLASLSLAVTGDIMLSVGEIMFLRCLFRFRAAENRRRCQSYIQRRFDSRQ